MPPVEATKPTTPIEKPAFEPEIAPKAQPEIVALTESKEEAFLVPPPTPGVPEAVPEVVVKQQVEEQPPSVPEGTAPARKQAPADEEAARRAREQEAVKLEQTRRQEEAKRQEEIRRQEEAKRQQEARAEREAAELESRRRAERQAEEAARQQAAAIQRQRALELEAKRQEKAKRQEELTRQQAAAIERQRALELEAKRQEEAKREEEAKAARRAMEIEALRQEAARQRELEEKKQAEERAARERAERLAAEIAASRTPLPAREPGRSADATTAPGNLSGRDLAAKALEQARTPGALRTEPQGPRAFPASPPTGADSSRRRSVLGGRERDVGLRMYVESWRWKIERYGNLNYAFRERDRATENPVVTVAIRRDGSVEHVHIHRSSGQRDLDEAVRRIVELNAPYSAFPPDLARAYDVIEIRRVWLFSETLRILEELR